MSVEPQNMTSTGVQSHPNTGAAKAATPASPEQARDELVARAAGSAPEIADLIRLYYRYVPPEEVIDFAPADLVGAVRAPLDLAAQRVPGRPVIRPINPKAE